MNENIIEVVEEWAKSKAENIIRESKTYGEALKKAKSYGLAYQHGNLGLEIDSLIYTYISDVAINQSIISNETTADEE